MGGNRKHGFRRGNRGGFKPQPMWCHGCGKFHKPRTDMTRALDGNDYCNRTYLAARERIADDEKPTTRDAVCLPNRNQSS